MVLDYLNQNSLRNYPIVDDLSRISTDNLFTIPNTLIVDLTLSASGVAGTNLYISSVTNTSNLLSIQISVSGVGIFGTFTTSLPTSDTNFDLQLQPSAAFPDANGIITIGSTSDLSSQPSGTFAFAVTSTQLLNHCTAIGNTGVTRINFTDTSGITTTLSGAVTIVANSNLRFSASGSSVYMDAGENLGLNKQCTPLPNPILTINGVTPDTYGNFNLVADPSSCISISSIQYGALISDSCGKPCLGSIDIATLTTRVNVLESDIYTLTSFSNNLQTLITQANMLLSYQCQCPT